MPVQPVPVLYAGSVLAMRWTETLGDFYAACAMIGFLAANAKPALTPAEMAMKCWEIAAAQCAERHHWLTTPEALTPAE
jgi:hypothetical protein